ncbi:13010_t:CDS:2, partial [Acaulospora colombiana]
RGRPKSEIEILQEQIEDIQTIQFQQFGQIETLFEMAVLNESATSFHKDFLNQHMTEQDQDNPLNNDGVYEWNEIHSFSDIDQNTSTSLNQVHSEETLNSFMEFSSKVPKRTLSTQIQDPMDQLVEQFNNDLNLESTRYVGADSLLLMDNHEEQIIPQKQDDLSSVESYLKVLPNPEIVDGLIDIYFQAGQKTY